MFNDNCWPWNSKRPLPRWRMKRKKECWCWLIYSLGSFSLDESFIRWKMKINYITIFLFIFRSPLKSLCRTENKKKIKFVIKNDDTHFVPKIRFFNHLIFYPNPRWMENYIWSIFFSWFPCQHFAKLFNEKYSFTVALKRKKKENEKSFFLLLKTWRNEIMIHFLKERILNSIFQFSLFFVILFSFFFYFSTTYNISCWSEKDGKIKVFLLLFFLVKQFETRKF